MKRRHVPNFTNLHSLTVDTMNLGSEPDGQPLVSLTQWAGGMMFMHHMTPAQACQLASYLVEAATGIDETGRAATLAKWGVPEGDTQ